VRKIEGNQVRTEYCGLRERGKKGPHGGKIKESHEGETGRSYFALKGGETTTGKKKSPGKETVTRGKFPKKGKA